MCATCTLPTTTSRTTILSAPCVCMVANVSMCIGMCVDVYVDIGAAHDCIARLHRRPMTPVIYVSAHTRTHARDHTRTHARDHTRSHAHTHVHTHTHRPGHTCTHTHAFTHARYSDPTASRANMYTCWYKNMCTCLHTSHMSAHMSVHCVCTYLYTHTEPDACRGHCRLRSSVTRGARRMDDVPARRARVERRRRYS